MTGASRLLFAGLLLAAATGARAANPPSAADPPEPLVLERTIPLPGVSGRIDHMAVDLHRGRILVAELGNGSVDVVEIASGNTVHRFDGLREPQGVGYSPGAEIIAVANAGDGSVHLFKAADFTPTGTIQLGEDADNVRLDPLSGNFLVGYGSGGIAVINPGDKATLISRAALAAHPEGFQLDPVQRRVFVNVPDARQLAVIDLNTGGQTETWRLPGLNANFPLALDSSRAVLATVFRNPSRLVLLDTRSGATKATLQTCGDADDVFFDARRQRIYVTCGAGGVDVMQADRDRYRLLARIKTAGGARTSLFVPEIDRLFVARRAAVFGPDAALLVFRPLP